MAEKHNMKRDSALKTIGFFALAMGVMMLLSIGQAHAIGIKSHSIVEGHDIRLGDVFYDLPRDEDRILGAAPRPGKDMVLNARTLMRIAVAMDLPWRPSSLSDRVVLRRSATVINDKMIEARIYEELKKQDVPGSFEIDLPRESSEIILPANAPETFDVTDLDFNIKNGVFTASIAAPSKDDPIQRLQFTGRIHKLISVPVLNRALNNGEIIRARHIDMIEMRSARINSGTILNVENLIGMTPRRMILDGKPVISNDVQAPRIVKRGESVTLNFKSGSLELSAMGKALEHGSKGDIVRVVNNSSNRTIEAVVTGEREVSVQTF